MKPSKTAKSRYFCHCHLFTFHSLVQLVLQTVKLNDVSQSISIEYKMVHGLNQAAFRTYNFENLAILDCSSFELYLEQVLHVTLSEKKSIISVTASQKLAMSATQLNVIDLKP